MTKKRWLSLLTAGILLLATACGTAPQTEGSGSGSPDEG